MDRQQLISQVKDEYASLAAMESQDSFSNQTDGEGSAEGYYEDLLGKVISGIQAGRFDNFQSGHEIMEAVANNKERWIDSASEMF